MANGWFLPDDLPGQLHHGVMAAAPLLIEPLGRAKHRHKEQSPDTVGPWHVGAQHTTEPAQATDFHKMRAGGAYRTTVDAPNP